MTFIGKNIKKIRSVKNWSQQAFADTFSITRASVGSYEEGRAEPKLATIIDIANYFRISVDSLLKKEMTVNELYSFDIGDINEPPKGRKLNIRKIQLGKGKSSTGVPFVQEKELQKYLIERKNKDYLSELPDFDFDTDEKGTYRAFENTHLQLSFEHAGIHIGDVLICKLMEKIDLKQITDGHIYFIVFNGGSELRRAAVNGKKILWKADNPEFGDFEIKPEDIQELWEVKGVFSRKLEFPVPMEIRLHHLEQRLDSLIDKNKLKH